ncbi:MAG: hypothetical protein IJT16_10100 [Lachnospiraceae bacterium]|nr:hypothetical protein [Lachnospiraceae bacterium]
MNILNATDVRKNWSVTLDTVIHEKPVYVKRTRDNLAILNTDTLYEVLSGYKYAFHKYFEDDNSVTLSTETLDLVVNAQNEEQAKTELAAEIKEYAEDFYDHYATWSAAPNRKAHIPLVLKALLLDESSIREELECQGGKN